MIENNKSFANELEVYRKKYTNKLKYDNKSVNTIKSYTNTIKSFIDYILQSDEELSFKTFKTSTIYGYFEYKELSMNKQGEISSNSKILFVNILRSFFTFIEDESEDLLSFEKVFKKINIKKKSSEPKGLSKSEQIKLLNQLEEEKTDNESYVSFRNSLIVKLMLFAGLRVSEVVNLKYSDLVLRDSGLFMVKIYGKGDKHRISYIQKEIIYDEFEEVKQYWEGSSAEIICLSSTGKRLWRTNIDKMVKSLCIRAGIAKYSSHKLRHTFAKNYLQQNGNIAHLQRLLGHSDIKTTMIYTDPYQEDMENGYVHTLSTI